jgi:hypothetical protein
MINNFMNIKDILLESPTDLIARYHRTPKACAAADRLNQVAEKFAEQNKEHYMSYFGEFYKNGSTPVFTTEDNNVTEATPLNNKPEDPQHASNGYRGIRRAMQLSGWERKK